MKKFFWDNKKNLSLLILALILMVGIFLRTYNFANWMHFELDQSRDAKVVGLAVEQGIGNLPLLGPKAAGSFLRLGPIFYYFNYISAKIFGNTPSGMAVVSLIFSCLTLPLFYFFVRRYFSQKNSLMLLAVFSTSIFLVMYARFSWNPNNIPFFALAGLYALLRTTDTSEKKKGWWLVVASLMLTIVTQLHFVAFLAFLIVAIAYLSIKRPSINWKYWLASILCVLFLYFPVIINDFKTGGDNMVEFKKVFTETSTKSDHTIIEKIIRNIDESSAGYVLLLSGNSQAELPRVNVPRIRPHFLCDVNCERGIPMGIVSLVFVFTGTTLLFWSIFKTKESEKKDFLLIIAIWLIVSLALFTPISYDMAPRFLLIIAPIPFIFLGFILDFFEKKRIRQISWILIVLLIVTNGFYIKKRFNELATAHIESFKISSDKIIKERDRVTLAQQLLITDYIENVYKKNKFPVYINSEAFYRRSFLYHLEQRGVVRDDFRNTAKTVYANGNYFLIYPSKDSPEKISKKYLDNYSVSSVKDFGTLRIVSLVPKIEAINAQEQIFGPAKKPTSATGVPIRCRWNEIFSQCNSDGTEAEDESSL